MIMVPETHETQWICMIKVSEVIWESPVYCPTNLGSMSLVAQAFCSGVYSGNGTLLVNWAGTARASQKRVLDLYPCSTEVL